MFTSVTPNHIERFFSGFVGAKNHVAYGVIRNAQSLFNLGYD